MRQQGFFSLHWYASLTVIPNYVPGYFFENMSWTCSFASTGFFDNSHFWLMLVHLNFCIIIYSFFCQFPFAIIDADMIRSSCLDVFCKKDVLKNFAKCTRKHQCWRLFNNKVESLKRATLSEKKQRCRWLLVSFAKFPRTNTTTPGHCLRKITPAVYCSTTVFRLVLKFRVISHIFSSRGLSGSSL